MFFSPKLQNLHTKIPGITSFRPYDGYPADFIGGVEVVIDAGAGFQGDVVISAVSALGFPNAQVGYFFRIVLIDELFAAVGMFNAAPPFRVRRGKVKFFASLCACGFGGG